MTQTVEVIRGRSNIQTKQCLYALRLLLYNECWCHYRISVQCFGTLRCLIPFSVLWISEVIVTLSCVTTRMAWINMITRQTLLPSPSLVFYSSQTLHLVQFALCFGGENRSLECLSA